MKNRELKLKLKSIEEPKEQIGVIKDVDYIYSIDDSIGLLKITLSMYNEIDPLEEFLRQVPNLYKYNVSVTYIVYYRNYKYVIIDGYVKKVKMY